MSKFKVGDRVRIVSLGAYGHSESQGLVVGNTGTVHSFHPNGWPRIKTDNATEPLSMLGNGWNFPGEHCLELLAPASRKRPSFLRRLFGAKAAA